MTPLAIVAVVLVGIPLTACVLGVLAALGIALIESARDRDWEGVAFYGLFAMVTLGIVVGFAAVLTA